MIAEVSLTCPPLVIFNDPFPLLPTISSPASDHVDPLPLTVTVPVTLAALAMVAVWQLTLAPPPISSAPLPEPPTRILVLAVTCVPAPDKVTEPDVFFALAIETPFASTR